MTYVVGSGTADNLTSVAAKFNLSPDLVRKYNPGVSWDNPQQNAQQIAFIPVTGTVFFYVNMNKVPWNICTCCSMLQRLSIHKSYNSTFTVFLTFLNMQFCTTQMLLFSLSKSHCLISGGMWLILRNLCFFGGHHQAFVIQVSWVNWEAMWPPIMGLWGWWIMEQSIMPKFPAFTPFFQAVAFFLRAWWSIVILSVNGFCGNADPEGNYPPYTG